MGHKTKKNESLPKKRGKSLVTLLIFHPFKVLTSVNWTNIKLFFSVWHYNGFRSAISTTSRVLNNSMDDYNRASNYSYQSEFEKTESSLEVPLYECPLVSIIVPTYNQSDLTLSCINSIINNTKEIPYELIVSDDCSTDNTIHKLNQVSNLKLVCMKKNEGFINNCNVASESANGKYIVFLNNDTVVGDNWLKPLVQLIESDSTIGIVGSKLVYPDGILQTAGGIIWSDGTAYYYGKGQNPKNPEYNYVKDVDYISGAALMIRSDLFKTVGGFDRLYVPAYCEDSDLCMTVREMGYQVKYQPLSVVIHFESVTHGKTKMFVAMNEYQSKNTTLFKNKWFKQLSENHAPFGTDVFHSRDRSFNKKCIMFVTKHTPSGNLGSQSKTTFDYICKMVNLGYNVKVITEDFHYDSDGIVPLEQMGIEVYYGIKYRDEWKKIVKHNRKNIDHIILVGHSVIDHFLPFMEKNTRARIHYLQTNNSIRGLEREYDLTKDRFTFMQLKNVEKCEQHKMKYIDDCIVMDQDTKEHLTKYVSHKDITIIPSPVPVEDSTHYNPHSKKILMIGDYNHRPTADALAWFTKEMMPEIKAKHPELCLHVLGSIPSTTEYKTNDFFIVEEPMSNDEIKSVLVDSLALICPMRISSGIMRSVLDAMSTGLPVISTKIGLEGLEIHDYPSYDSPQDIIAGIIRIVEDENYARQLSNRGLDYIRDNCNELNSVTAINSIFRE